MPALEPVQFDLASRAAVVLGLVCVGLVHTGPYALPPWRALLSRRAQSRGKDGGSQGLAQLDGYLSGLELDTGWLVIFDRRSGQPRISERTSAEAMSTPAGRSVTLVRA